jgi:hypothetical protein
MQLDVSPMAGDELQLLMTRIAATPAALVARYKAAVSSN